MNAIEFAFFRCARQLMSPDEVETVQHLARQAEAGNRSAAATVRMLCDRVIRRKQEKSDGETGGSNERQ